MQNAVSLNCDLTELKQILLKQGITLVGFADVRKGLAKEFQHIPKAISLALRHPPLDSANPMTKFFYSHHYEELDRDLEQTQKKIVKYLKNSGWKSMAIPPDSLRMDTSFISRLYPLFPHKTAATCAGLGWIGKSGLLVNEKYGPRMSWATVLTNAPLPVSAKPYLKGFCGHCRKCVKACPAGAIKDREWVREDSKSLYVDIKACTEQIKLNRGKLGQALCGLCVLACPLGWGKSN